MKYFLNGEPVEFEWTGEVESLSDRLIVRTNNGSFSALAVRDGDAILVSYQGYQYRLETLRNQKVSQPKIRRCQQRRILLAYAGASG